ncbi:protein DMR6-LIKE OXYGENASE 2 [Citrus sinensis]|uniref:protein DMR6-LIKE OXYGENASE 1-like isoform X1 n=1 Tax=Citrus sinensis TaxID=2711 RepID=UPI0021A069CA|nr:protein DMR6-LIKE OXYGENASE 1-like isoform X1 [Citrus sinensis]KAH9666738.1 protein DMR6-LIKE OXYGENASE 2 [Citrus sinensis]
MAAAATTHIKLLLSDLASTLQNVPSDYIRPISDRPNLTDQAHISDGSIPLIDLQGLYGPRRSDIIKQIGQACQHGGFFQVKNHGISEAMINNMLSIARTFFKLPERERLKNYSDDPLKPTRLSTSFNVKTEKASNRRDFLRLHCYPLQDYVHDWPLNPPSFREDVGDYCTSVRGLVLRLIEAISESLRLPSDYIDKEALGKHGQHMALNYYPPCPPPELTYGLPGHTDPNLITIHRAVVSRDKERTLVPIIAENLHLIADVDNEGAGNRIYRNTFAVSEDLQSRDIILKKNSY